MQISREEALAQASSRILDTTTFVRAVLSGRRRNMQVEFERIDIRLVEIKGVLNLQLMQNDGRATTTKNLLPEQLAVEQLLDSGYANITVESTHEAYSVRITKSGDAQVHTEKRESEQNLAHDKKKDRLLDSNDPFLREVGIADAKGIIKPSRQDKYKQVEEFLRLLSPTLNAAIQAGQIDKPTEQKRLSAAELEYITDHTEVEDTVVDGKVTNRISWATLMGYKQTWAFAIGKFMTDGVWWFFLFWLPGYLKDQYSMEGTAIIIPLTVLYSMTMVGSIGGGYFPTYFINKGMKPYDGRMKAMLMIAFIPLVVLAVQPLGYLSYWVPVIFIGIGASAHQAWSANIYTTVSDMFPKRSIATVVGIGGMAGGLGGVVVSKVGGWLFDSYKLKAVNATWSSATNTSFSDYLNKVVSLNVTDKKGVLVNVAQKDWSNLTKDIQAKLQAVDPTQYELFIHIQKEAVRGSLTTAYSMMFAFCAVAYLIAWSIMKSLVPKEKIINL